MWRLSWTRKLTQDLGWVILSAVLLGALGCGAGTTAPEVAPQPVSHELRLHYFNDWHGHLEPYEREGESVGGAARLYSLLEDKRASAQAAGADSLLLVAGDILQGTPMSTVFRGRPDYDLLNRMKLDAMSLGNHEFDYGRQVLDERIAQSEFPILAANVYKADGSPLVPHSVSVETAGGLKVGIVGVVTQETAQVVLPRVLEGLTFSNPVEEVRARVPHLTSTSDFVAVVSHCGYDVDRELARIPGVDVVVGGHDQVIFEEIIDGVPVVQAKDWGEYLGELVFRVDPGKVTYVSNTLHHVDSTVEPDPEVEQFVAGYRTRLGEEMGEVLTVAKRYLDGSRDAVRTRETNLGNLLADIIKEMAVADVAVLNGGTIRAPIDEGEVTLEEVLEVLPFNNEIVNIEIKGRHLQAMMDRSAGLGPTDGAFLQISGFQAILHAEGASLTYEGKPLDPDQTFHLATTDYMGDGGDGYDILVGLPRVKTGLLMNSVVVDWMREKQEIDQEVDFRLTRQSQDSVR